MSLHTLGWTDTRQSELTRLGQPELSPARISRQDRERYLLLSGDGEFEAQVSGRFRHLAPALADYPAVGDWVAVELRPGEQSATIHHLLARTSSFSRKVAGRQTEQQVVAANVDTVLLVSGLDGDFNPRRIERYVSSAWESGARPVVVLNKADVCDDVEARVDEVQAVAFGLPVHAVSAAAGDGIEALRAYLAPGQTVALLGSTGSGKSTVINLIPRFYDVTDGAIYVDGMDIRQVRQGDLRAKIGYIPQKGLLFSGTIESNLLYADKNATPLMLREAADMAQASEFIFAKDEGMSAAIAQGGGNVSGGQKQRLAIARALLKKPPIYIFDDSFSALDYKTDAALRRALKDKIGDSTVIVVTQRVGTIKHADQIVVLDEGGVVGKGKHRELLETCETYREIAFSQLSKEELA